MPLNISLNRLSQALTDRLFEKLDKTDVQGE